jgi:dodecin
MHDGGIETMAGYWVAPPSVRQRPTQDDKEIHMAESVYKVIELVGTSTESWEKAAAAAVSRAAKTLRDLRVAEISQLDMQLKNGKVESYRAKVKVSFKYEGG